MTKRTLTLVTWFLTLWFRTSLSQIDCTGVDCPPLENCIEEVLEMGACCATCTQRGCACEGYQYYDCIKAKFQNGKVPEGEFYLVDDGSTNCTCPVGGGRISCRFIHCEAVPPNCIDLAVPPDACPHCLRIGCVFGPQRFEAGHSFHMDPCQVCHCPNNGGELMCSLIPDCNSETHRKHSPHREFHPSHRPSDDRRYNYVSQTTANPVVASPSLGFTKSVPRRLPHEPKAQLPEGMGTNNPNEDATRTFQQNHDGLSTRIEPVNSRSTEHGGVRPSQLPSGDSTPEGHKRESGRSSGQRKLQYRIPDHGIINNKLQSSPTTSPPVNLKELGPYRQSHLWDSFREGRSHQFSRTDRNKVSSLLVERCCAAGENWLSDHDHCGNMVPIRGEEPDSACWSVQKQCCMSWWRDRRCSAGLDAAKQGQGCEPDAAEPCDSYQECCGCCELGLRLHAEEEDWEIPRGLGEPCSHIILSCYEATTRNNLSSIREITEPHGTSRPTEVVPGPDRQSFSLEKVEDTENMVLEVEDVDECELYKNLLCHHECVNIPGSYVCTCHTGYVLQQDGINCLPVQLAEENQVKEESQDIEDLHPAETPSTPPAPPDPCEGNGPCAQHCTPVAGRPQCSCSPGFSLMSDGRSCEDTDECALSTHTCQVSERCINTLGDFSCERSVVCPSGYHIRNHVCEDLNECIMGTHSCGLGFDCINTAGSFSCRARTRCPGGFTHDPQGQCVDIDECRTVNQPCSPGFNCINTYGSYSCQRSIIMCNRGYHTSPDGSGCADIDECATGVHRCVEDQLCNNLPGTYRCDCRPGYQYDGVRRMCVDVNECWRYRLCAQTCENTPGSYRCSCTSGFSLSADGKNCEDVNECLSSPCSQECNNVYGSFQCHCRQGYYLNEDGVTCKDYDECSQSVGNLCAYKCVNVPGSYSCVCPEHGYTMASNRRSCRDIDECGTSAHNCTADQTCYNIQGGFRCLSFGCPTNYRRSSDARCERIACADFLLCQNTPARITYYYLTFQVNIIVPALIFRMGPSPAYSGDNIIMSITGGNEDGYFSPRKISTYTGAIYLQRQIPQPHDFLLDVEMKLFRQATLTTFQARIYVFVTAYLG